ncbi:MAG TPA: 23S rRNA (uridine(2552)-2'-O)-methyltransferase RlmE [Gammaproteobacteria bacterium]|nr:23S rRNA (uridine(2552)-2'-O)-methyltransferase RlmE [Gammaproteobacteria bacterium]
MPRSKSSKRWLERHHQDEYVQMAREQGYRSRAVFKLQQLQQKDRIFEPGQRVLDLGAAPGGWSEYAIQAVGERGRVFALDILPMDSIAGVEFLQGDFTESRTLDDLRAMIGQDSLDLVLSDMAPNMSGMQSVDQPRSIYLAELALDLSRRHLGPGGGLVVKLFQGEGFDNLIAGLRAAFASVKLRKPAASSSRSSEIYAVCRGLR